MFSDHLWRVFLAHFYGYNVFLELLALDPRFPQNATVVEGEQITLRCLPLVNVDKVNVTWLKKSGGNSSFVGATLNLSMNATRFDAGEYYCRVTNGVESIVSRTAYVSVLRKYTVLLNI